MQYAQKSYTEDMQYSLRVTNTAEQAFAPLQCHAMLDMALMLEHKTNDTIAINSPADFAYGVVPKTLHRVRVPINSRSPFWRQSQSQDSSRNQQRRLLAVAQASLPIVHSALLVLRKTGDDCRTYRI